MSSVLIQKLRAAREQKVPVGGYTFTVRRPTDIEMVALSGADSMARLLPYVIGWEGVKEIDIISGGDPRPVEFDADVCAEWMSDRPDLFGPLVDAILASYGKHAEQIKASVKN